VARYQETIAAEVLQQQLLYKNTEPFTPIYANYVPSAVFDGQNETNSISFGSSRSLISSSHFSSFGM